MNQQNQFITKNRLTGTRYAIIDFVNNEVLTANHLVLKEALRVKRELYENAPNLCVALTKNDVALYEVSTKGKNTGKRFKITDLWNRA